jgi:Rha family phage regulatory protein
MTMLALDPRQFIIANAGQPRTTSLKVAEAFGKRHDDVLRRLRTLECSADFRARNFAGTAETRAAGAVRREVPFYEMTKDGFMFLVMGFTGVKAARVKEAYINAFNWMAEQLAGRPAQPPAEGVEFAQLSYGAHALPVTRIAGGYWFGATVLARILGFDSANRITRRQDRGWITRVDTAGRSLQMLAWPSVLDALRRAQPERAEPFREWLAEALPGCVSGHCPAPAPEFGGVMRDARTLALDYFSSCRQAVDAAGGTRPQWDHAAEQRIADNMAALIVANKRWLMSIDSGGQPQLKALPAGAVVVDLADSERLTELLRLHAPDKVLPAIMAACLGRITARLS